MLYCKGSSTLQERSWRSHPNPGGWKSCLSLQTPPPPETELHWIPLWQCDMKDEKLKVNVGCWFCRTSTSVSRELQKCILATDPQTYNRNPRGAMRSRNIWSSTQMCKKHASDIHQSASTSNKISKHLDKPKNAHRQTGVQIGDCVNKSLYFIGLNVVELFVCEHHRELEILCGRRKQRRMVKNEE